MKHGIQLRLAGLGLGLGFMGLLIVIITLTSQKQAKELRNRLNQVDTESFWIADRFKNSLRDVTDHLRAYRAEREPAMWQEFLKAGSDLHDWVAQQRTRLTTASEQEVLQQIDEAYDQYLRMAKEFHAHPPPPSQAASPSELSRFVEQSRRLSDLGQLLARAHYNSRNE
jgi:hypothetical protein